MSEVRKMTGILNAVSLCKHILKTKEFIFKLLVQTVLLNIAEISTTCRS